MAGMPTRGFHVVDYPRGRGGGAPTTAPPPAAATRDDYLALVVHDAAAYPSHAPPYARNYKSDGVVPSVGDVLLYRVDDGGGAPSAETYQGIVEAVAPDFGGDGGGGVRLAATIAPHPPERKMRGLTLAAAAAARRAMRGEEEADGEGVVPAPFEEDATVTLGVSDIFDHVVVGTGTGDGGGGCRRGGCRLGCRRERPAPRVAS